MWALASASLPGTSGGLPAPLGALEDVLGRRGVRGAPQPLRDGFHAKALVMPLAHQAALLAQHMGSHGAGKARHAATHGRDDRKTLEPMWPHRA